MSKKAQRFEQSSGWAARPDGGAEKKTSRKPGRTDVSEGNRRMADGGNGGDAGRGRCRNRDTLPPLLNPVSEGGIGQTMLPGESHGGQVVGIERIKDERPLFGADEQLPRRSERITAAGLSELARVIDGKSTTSTNP